MNEALKELIARLDTCKNNGDIVAAVNDAICRFKERIGEEAFEVATQDYGLLEDFPNIDELRAAHQALDADQEARDKDDVLDDLSGILLAGVSAYHRLPR